MSMNLAYTVSDEDKKSGKFKPDIETKKNTELGTFLRDKWDTSNMQWKHTTIQRQRGTTDAVVAGDIVASTGRVDFYLDKGKVRCRLVGPRVVVHSGARLQLSSNEDATTLDEGQNDDWGADMFPVDDSRLLLQSSSQNDEDLLDMQA
jgi:hypothetical protein